MTRKIKLANRTMAALLCTSALMLTGCGSSFQGSALASKNTGSSITPPGDTTTTPPKDSAWENLKMDGSVAQNASLFAGEKTVDVDKMRNELVLRLPMLANPYLDGISLAGPIPDLPGATLGLEAMPNGGSALVLRIPLRYVLDGVEFLPAQRLPNGDPLPKIAAGELPSLAVSLTKLSKDIKASIYLGTSAVGIFVNTPFDPFLTASFPIKNKEGTRTWGYLSTVPAKGTHDGGFFLSFALPADLARIIDDHL